MVWPLDCQPLSADVLFSARLLGAHWFMSVSVIQGLDMAVAGSWQVSVLGSWAGWGQAMWSARALHCLSPQPPRPCEVYRAEWELCRSAGHVLHHYYVHGERPDCRQWLRDLTSCREWEESRSAEAQVRAGCGCARRSFRAPPPPCSPPEYPKIRYQRDFRPRQLRGEGRGRKGGI